MKQIWSDSISCVNWELYVYFVLQLSRWPRLIGLLAKNIKNDYYFMLLREWHRCDYASFPENYADREGMVRSRISSKKLLRHRWFSSVARLYEEIRLTASTYKFAHLTRLLLKEWSNRDSRNTVEIRLRRAWETPFVYALEFPPQWAEKRISRQQLSSRTRACNSHLVKSRSGKFCCVQQRS